MPPHVEKEESAAEEPQGKVKTAMKQKPLKLMAKTKAKAKAKAKALAKAKAKAKSKVTAKPKAKAEDPAGKGKTSMKRPSALQELQDNIHKSTAEPAEDHQHRDKGKAIKYNRQKSDLPPYIVSLIEEETKKSSSPRAAKTNLINKLYRKEADGSFSLQLSDPTFVEAQKIFNRKYKRTEDEAIPESLMVGLYFHGDRGSFDSALKKGEVFKVTEEGSDVDFYAFRKFVVGQEHGKETVHETNARKKISMQDLDSLKCAFRSLKWSFNFEKVDSTVDESGSLSDDSLKLLKQATTALEKLSKESRNLINTWSGGKEPLKELKAAYSKSLVISSKLSHLQDLGSFADGTPVTKNAFLSFIKEVAAEMEAFNVVFHRCKGEAKAQRA